MCATEGAHTLRVARTFFWHFFLRGVQTSRTRMAQGVCSAHVMFLRLALSVFVFHPPSLLFPHGHFDTSFPSAPSLPNCSRSESSGQAHFRMRSEEFGYLADPTHSTGYEPPQSSTRLLLLMVTRRPSTIRTTVPPKMITEMRGADLMCFRININL